MKEYIIGILSILAVVFLSVVFWAVVIYYAGYFFRKGWRDG